ncbi:MAG: Ldh family oxidoreductase, partial [Anaerolineae bacterium]|nr:Ldh family oxidoreductase [Anaerolineae bacterium]
MNDVTLPAAQWRTLCQRIIRSWNAPEDIATCVADSLVDSDLAGVYSHGVMRIPSYYACVKAGWYEPAERPEVVRESAATAMVDGHWGFGQPAMHKGLQVAMEKARAQGIASVGV